MKKTRPHYFPNRGKTSNLKKRDFICKLLAANIKAKLSDEQLAKKMKAEYPHSKVNYLKRFPAFRNLYNRGAFKSQKGKPSKPCPQFGSDGKPKVINRGPKPGSKRAA